MCSQKIIKGDCLQVMSRIESDSVDLVFGSPPYEDARTYGIDFKLKGQDWVDWMVHVFEEASRVSKGLVAFVVQGRTRKYKWTCTPALLIADLHRAGFNVRNPVIYNRSGIPGSGGPDWLRSDYEWVVCVTPPGRLVWSDNTACGNDPKFKPGGDPTHRKKDGKRVSQNYKPPKKTNPGNVIRCSGGHLGSKLAHENEAPFPEKLAEFFIKSFCPPEGIVLDPFLGSGTTCAVAKKLGRGYIGIDVRESQVNLTTRRLEESGI
jgi:DNA modification methylase